MAGPGVGGFFALFTSVVVPAATIFGAYATNENRRHQNYQMVLDTLRLTEAGAAENARFLVDIMTVDDTICPTADENGNRVGGGMFRGLRCDLSWSHQRALDKMIESKRAQFELANSSGGGSFGGLPTVVPQAMKKMPRSNDAPAGDSGDLLSSDGPAAAMIEAPAVQYQGAIRTVTELNDPNLATRLAAGQRLVDEYTDSPAALDSLLDWLDPTQIDDLSANGRYNVVYFLGRMELGLWSNDRVGRACEGLALIERRAESGVAALGDQTRGAMNDLRAQLKRTPSQGCASR